MLEWFRARRVTAPTSLAWKREFGRALTKLPGLGQATTRDPVGVETWTDSRRPA